MASSNNAATIAVMTMVFEYDMRLAETYQQCRNYRGDDDGAVIGKHDYVGAILAAGIRFGEHHMPDGCLRRPQRVAYLRGKRDETARHDRANRGLHVITAGQ